MQGISAFESQRSHSVALTSLELATLLPLPSQAQEIQASTVIKLSNNSHFPEPTEAKESRWKPVVVAGEGNEACSV